MGESPYLTRSPIADRRRLVGREEAITDIEAQLFRESTASVNLYGAARQILYR